jgi:uncharacterized protein YecT (DUF1311 family)
MGPASTVTRSGLWIGCLAVLSTIVLGPEAPAASATADQDAIAARYSPAFTACTKTAIAMHAMRECASHEVDYQQDALDREFNALLARYPRDHDRLQADQAHWSDQMNAQCTQFSRRQGSANSLYAMDCFRDEAIKRQIALETEYPGQGR